MARPGVKGFIWPNSTGVVAFQSIRLSANFWKKGRCRQFLDIRDISKLYFIDKVQLRKALSNYWQLLHGNAF